MPRACRKAISCVTTSTQCSPGSGPSTRDPKRPPTHPGAILREDVLPALGRPKLEIAKALGISRQTLYAILNERQPVTPEMALRIGKLCGNGPDLWLNIQHAYDLWHAARKIDVSNIPTLEPALAGRSLVLPRVGRKRG